MHYFKNQLKFGIIGVLILIALAAFIYFIDPQGQLISGLSIRPVVGLFVLFFAVCFFLGTFFFKNMRRGLLTAVGLTSITVFRFFGFRDLLYVGIIILIMLLIEGFYFKPPHRTHHSDSAEI